MTLNGELHGFTGRSAAFKAKRLNSTTGVSHPSNRKALFNQDFVGRDSIVASILVCSRTVVTENTGLNPVPPQQPHFDDLRKSNVAEQRQQKNWPVQPRQVSEA